jgi:hypothetical protein
MWARILNTGLGLWLMAAPAVLGFTDSPAATNHRIVGPLVVTFAFVAIWQVTRALRRINLASGLWLLAAPWIFGFPTDATVNAMVCGAAIAALSLVQGTRDTSFGGGWRVLWPPCRAATAEQRRQLGLEDVER